MTIVERLAQFVARASYVQLSEEARSQLRIRMLDAIGCAIGALGAEPPWRIHEYLHDIGPGEGCTLIGGGRASPDRAAFYNGVLVRYLDFNDSFLAKGETCHPSDNLGAVLAAAEYARATGKELVTALAVAYEVQCRLSMAAPVRARGFDHTTQGAYGAAAGVSAALRLPPAQIANAVAIAGTANNALRVTRTGALSNWKGLAFPNTGLAATHAAFLAMHGITGPLEVFEGNKGFMEAIAGRFTVDWSREDLELVRRTITKRFNAEIHSQSALEALLELRRQHRIDPERVNRIELEIFDVAYNIIGGGEEGEKLTVRTKEEADHSLPYLLAVALIDGQVLPAQYLPDRIRRADVQELLRRVRVREARDLSDRFPAEMPCRLRILMEDGQTYETAKSDYEGFLTRPMSWESARRKFETLTASKVPQALAGEIADAVRNIESITTSELTGLLGAVSVAEEAAMPVG